MISQRLQIITKMVGNANCAADIGTDHGFVPIELLKNGQVQRAIAMDVRPGPLKKAQENINRAGLSDRIEIRLSDGAQRLKPHEAEVITVCGMGGALITQILSARPEVFKSTKRMVLGPQSELYEFRKFLLDNGYYIADEAFIKDEGKYYFLMEVLPSGVNEEYTKAQLYYSRYALLRRDETLREYLLSQIDLYDRVYTKIPDKSCDAALKNRDMAEFVREVYGEYYD